MNFLGGRVLLLVLGWWNEWFLGPQGLKRPPVFHGFAGFLERGSFAMATADREAINTSKLVTTPCPEMKPISPLPDQLNLELETQSW